jgi:colicin import membrane protein
VANVRNNFAPISLAVLLHVAVFGTMLVAVDFAEPAPITPMAIRATLVVEDFEPTPPPVKEIELPDPEPVEDDVPPEPIEEDVPPEPDNSDELRQAEEKKRLEDALIEKTRLEKLRQQEVAEKKRIQREREARKKRDDAEKERKRLAAEKKRQEDARRQREENERTRRELEAKQRQAEVDAEERRFTARHSAEMSAYQFAIAQRIRRNWSVPASAGPETRCSVSVQQLPGGDIVSVNILNCNGDEAVKRSVEAAIRRSSPLPDPSNPDLFDRNLTLHLTLARED